MNKIAVILVRGTVNLSPDVKKTLELLRLRQKFACVVVDDTPMYRGMIQKVKDYVTYGEIEQAQFKTLVEKRGKVTGDEPVDSKTAEQLAKKYFEGNMKLRDFSDFGVKPFFRMHPPEKGFERKGIKKPYGRGGALGYRGPKIADLIERMM